MDTKDQPKIKSPNDFLKTLPKHLRPGDLGDLVEALKGVVHINHESLKYRNVFMGFLDILGYQNLINEFGDDAPRVIYEDILRAFSWARSSKVSLKVTLFSDTLIVEAEDDHPVAFWNIMNVMENFRNQLLEKGYLVRGSIVHGQHFCEKDIWISPCLIKAYRLENEIANVARILIDEDSFDIWTKSIIKRGLEYGMVYDRYFVKVDPTIINTDFDGNRVLRFHTDLIEVNYLKYEKYPDQKNLDQERIKHCIDAGNQRLKIFQNGLKLALERAKDEKSRSKVTYFIIKWNEYCEEFELKSEFREEYKIDITQSPPLPLSNLPNS